MKPHYKKQNVKFLKYFTIANHEITWREFIESFPSFFMHYMY